MSHDYRSILVLVSPPDDDVVTLAEMKAHLRKDDSDEDGVIQNKIDEAVGLLDPASGGALGRALRTQTWELQLDRFPGCQIELPYPPLISIVSVNYDDASGVEHTLVEDTDFRILGMASLYKQSIAPVFNRQWPAARCDIASVRIRFTCGYPIADGDTVDQIPNGIKGYVKLLAADLYANREGTIDSRLAVPEENPNLRRLLDQHRVFTDHPVSREHLRLGNWRHLVT